tara:strand:+ start:4513 stop:4776 length:264 start_codon:yes stop_codon:yes gene_type:complete
MSEEIAAAVNKSVASAIELHVNGGIRKIHTVLEKQNEKQEEFNKKVDAHIAKVEPYLQSAAGLNIIWKGLVAIALGWVAIKNGLLQI